MTVQAIATKLKQRAKADSRGQHFEAALIVQAVSWYLRIRSTIATSRSCS